MLVKMVFGTVSHPVWNAKNGDLDINNKPWLKSNYFIVYLYYIESVKVFLKLKIYKVFYDKIKIIGGLFIMAREKKSVHKVQMTDGKRNIIRQLLEEYEIESAQDIQDALKDLLGGTIKEMMESEMDEHLGYRKSERSDCDDYRNGYKTKQVNSSYGSMKVEVPQDRNSTFEPQVVKKRQKDISNIDQKIISMYAKGMTTRQISETLEDIYGFEASEGFISDVTDKPSAPD